MLSSICRTPSLGVQLRHKGQARLDTKMRGFGRRPQSGEAVVQRQIKIRLHKRVLTKLKYFLTPILTCFRTVNEPTIYPMTNSMPDVALHFQLLQASADSERESEVRILVDGRFIKYLTVDPGLYDVDDLCCGPLLASVLPPLPPGDWNQGRISRSTLKGCHHFSESTKTILRGVTSLWNPPQIEYLDLQIQRILPSNVYELTCPHSNSTIVAKLARFAWEIP
jgi:hypothetical protein